MDSGTEDPHIVDSARRGDRAAWDQIYRQLYPRLRAYFARNVGGKEAQDAVNETMAKAIAGIESYREGDVGIAGWVFGIARHVSADHHRRTKRDRRQPHVAYRVDGHGPEVGLPVDHDLDLAGDHARLRAMFARLAPAEREILELRVVAGLSTEDVAALLERSPGAVRTSQSRALAHLRKLMEVDRVDA